MFCPPCWPAGLRWRLDWQLVRQRRVRNCSSYAHLAVLLFLIGCVYFVTFSTYNGTRSVRFLQTPEHVAKVHPVIKLASTARDKYQARIKSQSKTLSQAVEQYKQRHRISPPPYFDQWYAFAKRHQVPLLDEFDQIFDDLRPFWGISPALIRREVALAIDTDDFIAKVSIQGGEVTVSERGDPWWANGLRDAIQPFAHLLPDMTMAFNEHDEPRSVIPHDQLTQMLRQADQQLTSHSPQRKTWSSGPPILETTAKEQTRRSPFFEASHPFTWTVITLSCPPDSPARVMTFNDMDGAQGLHGYMTAPINFIEDRLGATDVCSNPSLKDLHSIFRSPNMLSVTHEPIPIFSASKISSFQDILYPAVWYLQDKAIYNEAEDIFWSKKQQIMYWRGATNSGSSRNNGMWRSQPRQRFVESVERAGRSYVLRRVGTDGAWFPHRVSREHYQDWFDVHFSIIDNCSGVDCEDQLAYFDVKAKAPFEDNWKNQFLLDIDGHGLSGRFYSFLRSRSLTLKSALFQEWHETRLVPWVHYIPLGFNASDHLEIMRFVKEEVEGDRLAQEIAEASRLWANQSLRYVDLQAWLFRLLLEYARLVDDRRQELGYE